MSKPTERKAGKAKLQTQLPTLAKNLLTLKTQCTKWSLIVSMVFDCRMGQKPRTHSHLRTDFFSAQPKKKTGTSPIPDLGPFYPSPQHPASGRPWFKLMMQTLQGMVTSSEKADPKHASFKPIQVTWTLT